MDSSSSEGIDEFKQLSRKSVKEQNRKRKRNQRQRQYKLRKISIGPITSSSKSSSDDMFCEISSTRCKLEEKNKSQQRNASCLVKEMMINSSRSESDSSSSTRVNTGMTLVSIPEASVASAVNYSVATDLVEMTKVETEEHDNQPCVNACDHESNSDAVECSSSDSSSSEEEDAEIVKECIEERQKLDLLADLQDFWTESKQTASSMTLLLKKLHRHFPGLPCDARTLMPVRPSFNCNFKEVAPGHYIHFGVASGLKEIFSTCKPPSCIELILHVDSVELTKSGMKELWPVLIAVKEVRSSIFIAGAYAGERKPESSTKLLEDTVHELNDILLNGLQIGDIVVTVSLSHCACDSIARAFVKNIKYPTGFYACDRCEAMGVTIDGSRRFLDHDVKRRTDESFRTQAQSEHHIGESPFLIIESIDMVASFPNDYMHSVCEGTVLKLLELCRVSGGNFRLSKAVVKEVNAAIKQSRSCVPDDFQRRPRTIKHLGKWKATELRFFALYVGPYILQKFSPTVGKLLLWLSVVMRFICHQEWSTRLNGYAKKLADAFLKKCRKYLGRKFLSLTVHSLVHLVEDCSIRGAADNFSCFSFESYLKFVRDSVHSAFRPLEQLKNQVSRHGQHLGQLRNYESSSDASQDHVELLEPVSASDVVKSSCDFKWKSFQFFYRAVQLQTTKIRNYGPNRYVLTKGGHVLKVRYIGVKDNDVWLIGQTLRNGTAAFSSPLDSTRIDIFRGRQFGWKVTSVNVHRQLKCKMMRFNNIFIPLLHTYKHE
jgi:hypothetical protein